MTDYMTGSLFEEEGTAAGLADAIDFVHAHTAVYTKSSEVEALLDHIGWPACGGRMADASCGDGAVIVVALDRLLAAGPLGDDEIAHRVQAYEMHGFAVAEARANVATVLVEHGRTMQQARALAARIVHHLDFLTDGPATATFNWHVGNPPYMRLSTIPEPLKSTYVRVVPKAGRNDMAHSFLLRCLATLLPGGMIAFVLADRVLFNKSAAAMRAELGRNLTVLHAQRLDAESVFYRPKLRRRNTPPRVHPIRLVLGSGGMPLTAEPIYPGARPGEFDHLPTLGDLATVRLAPYLGKRGLFFMTRAEAHTAGIPEHLLVPAVEPSDLRHGVMAEPRLVAIRTFAAVPPCAAVRAHLKRNKHLWPDHMLKRGIDEVWTPKENFEGWDLDVPSLVVPRAVKVPVAARVRPGVLPIGHDLSIVTAGPAMLDIIERAFQKPVVASWLRAYAPPIDGGFYALDPDLLRKMPVDRRRHDRESDDDE